MRTGITFVASFLLLTTWACRPARPALPLQAGRLVVAPPMFTEPSQVGGTCAHHLRQAEMWRGRVLAVKSGRTLASTLEPTNRLWTELDRILPLMELIANVHQDQAIREAAERCERRVKRYVSKLQLDRGVYDAVKAVPKHGLDPLAQRFRKHLLRDYRRSGVHLDKGTRAKLSALKVRMVKLSQQFAKNIRMDQRAIRVSAAELEGVPADFVDAKKKRAKGGGLRVTTAYPDLFPVLRYARREDVRRRLYSEFLSRAYPQNEGVIKQLLAARHAYATTLGFPDWADYQAKNKMIGSREAISRFLERVAKLARPAMERERAAVLERKRRDRPEATTVRVWDRFYYPIKIRNERFRLDPKEVRAYFPFRKVKKGLLALIARLFAVRFEPVLGVKTWHPQVDTYDVYEGGRRLGRFYLDLHPRKGKYGHAAVFPIYGGLEGVQLPSAALVANLPNPAAMHGPALMEHNQVRTFLHELGHLIHHLLAGRRKWVTLTGISCEWDFVEAPSQLLEEWAWEHSTLSTFARHYRTGRPIPKALASRLKEADKFGKGLNVMSQLFYASVSYGFHAKSPRGLDPLNEMRRLQTRYSPYPYAEGTAFFANFGHLNGYSSMYYTYMWSLVLAKDLFTRFRARGLMDRQTALRYRRTVLEPGGSKDAAQMVRDFLGRPYSFKAYQRWLHNQTNPTP